MSDLWKEVARLLMGGVRRATILESSGCTISLEKLVTHGLNLFDKACVQLEICLNLLWALNIFGKVRVCNIRFS